MTLYTELGHGAAGWHGDDAVVTRTTLSNLRTLANEIRTDHNAVVTKLDADAGVSDTNYAATRSIAAAAVGAIPATLGVGSAHLHGDDGVRVRVILQDLRTLANEIKTDTNALLTKLDADGGVADTNYADTTATNEVQTITVTATGGTFTLTYGGQTTDPIAEAATAATVQIELEQLSSIAVGDVAVTGSAGGPYTVTFGGTLDAEDVGAITASAALLTKDAGSGTAVVATTTAGAAHTPTHATTLAGGTAATVDHATLIAGAAHTPTHATTVAGVAPVNEVQGIKVNAAAGQWKATFDGQQTADLAYDVTAGDLQTALRALTSINGANVTVTGGPGDSTGSTPYVVTFVGTLAGTDVAAITTQAGTVALSGSTGGTDPNAATVTTTTPGVAAVNEQQTITLTGGPNVGTFTVTWEGQTTDWMAYNESAASMETKLEALSNVAVGEINVGRTGAGTAGDPYVYTLTFENGLGGADQDQATSTPTLLGINEVQTVTLTGGPNVGNFTVTWEGQTTGNIAYNSSAAAFKTALEALSNVEVDEINVERAGAGTSGSPYEYTLYFQNALGAANQDQATSAEVGLGVNEVQTVTLTGGSTTGNFTLTYSGQTTGNIAYNASAATVVTALEALSNIGVGDVGVVRSGAGTAGDPYVYTVTFQAVLGNTDVAELTSTSVVLGINEVQSVTTSAVGGTYTITYSGQTTTALAWNATAGAVQTALIALSNLATGDVVVTGGPGDAAGTTPYVLTYGGTLAATNVSAVTTTVTALVAIGTVGIVETTPGNESNSIVTADVGAVRTDFGAGGASLHGIDGQSLRGGVRGLIAMLNEAKAKRNVMLTKLDADATVTDTNYSSLHATTTANVS